jgi:site-specific DNA-cytosine methylase
MPAVAFDARQSDVIQYGEKTGPLDTDGHSDAVAYNGDDHAHAAETGPVKALRALLETLDEEAGTRWGLGILAAFWPQEVLRSKVHGGSFRLAAYPERGLVRIALSRAQPGATWTVPDLWEAGCRGRPPQGWEPPEQLARELGAYLSQLPQSPSPAERFLRALWQAAEGLWLLREALSEIQEIRQSQSRKDQSTPPAQVRRLVAEECEALQGFPRGYTLIPYRGKPAADGPRYKALGNSMAVPCMRWLGVRINQVEAICAELDEAEVA